MSAFDEFEVCRNILESLPTGLCVVDIEKRIIYWSDGAERITGRLRHEVAGHSCVAEALLHCRQAGCEFCSDECALAKAMKTANAVEASGFLHHKSGYEIPVRARAVPVHNPHGSIIGAVEIFEHLESCDVNGTGRDLLGRIDDASGLPMQAQTKFHLQEALGAFAERRFAFSVLRFRLHGLQRFRAAFGPDAASSLLLVVAQSLASSLWRADIVGRWADDEFFVILNGCGAESLPGVRERLRHMLANEGIEWWGEQRNLPVSIGEATAQATDTMESILDRTQQSLDKASEWLSPGSGAQKNGSSGS